MGPPSAGLLDALLQFLSNRMSAATDTPPAPWLAHTQIHFCVLLWGFTAILGKLISLDALALVWWRMLLVVGALALWPPLYRSLRRMGPRLMLIYLGIGGLVALHWLTFYGAIKLANASVAVTTMAFAPVFLACIEPLIARRKLAWSELLLGLLVLPGVALVVGGVDRSMYVGFAVGVLSALLVAIFGSLNKRHVLRGDPLAVTGLEMAAGVLVLSLLAPWLVRAWPGLTLPWRWPAGDDLWLLLLLALGCTLLPFALSLVALRQLSAFSAQLAINLEPVYAILLAMLLLGEQTELSLSFYLGVAVLLLGVFIHPLLTRRAIAGPGDEPTRTAD